MPAPRVVLEDLADQAALGVEDGQAAADLGREGEQVQLGAQLAVVAFLRLLQERQVLVLAFAGLPGGAVDPLQLGVLLAAPPVGAAAAHQLERRDLPGGGQVRTAAQVLPPQFAGTGVQVVVDGQLGTADLDALAQLEVQRAGRVPLEADQLQLVGLGGEFGPGLLVGHHPAGEPLALPDDLAHPGLDGLQVLRGERLGHVEVVVEAVLDRRADTQLGLREQLLYGLGHDVRGRMPHDVPAVVAGDAHRLHDVPVGHLVGQVAQLAVDPGGDRGAVAAGHRRTGRSQRRARRRARLDHMLASGEGDARLRAGHGGLLQGREGWYPMLPVPGVLGVQAGPAQRVGQRAPRSAGGGAAGGTTSRSA